MNKRGWYIPEMEEVKDTVGVDPDGSVAWRGIGVVSNGIDESCLGRGFHPHLARFSIDAAAGWSLEMVVITIGCVVAGTIAIALFGSVCVLLGQLAGTGPLGGRVGRAFCWLVLAVLKHVGQDRVCDILSRHVAR